MKDNKKINHAEYLVQQNPDYQIYPIFEYFENWCQDENRHGEFFCSNVKDTTTVFK
jgi:phage portal protein BeeE